MPAPTKYPPELRERAVRLYQDTNPRPTIKQLATQLGVHPEALRGWIRQATAEREGTREGPSQAVLDENRQLKKENAELRRINEILKAASAYFAQELDSTRRRS
jgi:transposase